MTGFILRLTLGFFPRFIRVDIESQIYGQISKPTKNLAGKTFVPIAIRKYSAEEFNPSFFTDEIREKRCIGLKPLDNNGKKFTQVRDSIRIKRETPARALIGSFQWGAARRDFCLPDSMRTARLQRQLS